MVGATDSVGSGMGSLRACTALTCDPSHLSRELRPHSLAGIRLLERQNKQHSRGFRGKLCSVERRTWQPTPMKSRRLTPSASTVASVLRLGESVGFTPRAARMSSLLRATICAHRPPC